MFGNAFVPDARYRSEQPPLNEPQDGFVFDLQKAGHFVCCIYFHWLSTFGRGAPIPSGRGAAHAIVSVAWRVQENRLGRNAQPDQWQWPGRERETELFRRAFLVVRQFG